MVNYGININIKSNKIIGNKMKHNIHIFFENILRKNAVFKKNILVLIMVIWWWFFSSSSFYGDFNLCETINGEDREYYINVYEHLPTTPLAVYKLIQGKRYFYVLYNKQGKKIWRSPHYAYLYDNVDSFSIPTKKSNSFEYYDKEWKTVNITIK